MNLNNRELQSYNKMVNQHIRQRMQEPKIQLIIAETVLNHPDIFKYGMCKVDDLKKKELGQ